MLACSLQFTEAGPTGPPGPPAASLVGTVLPIETAPAHIQHLNMVGVTALVKLTRWRRVLSSTVQWTASGSCLARGLVVVTRVMEVPNYACETSSRPSTAETIAPETEWKLKSVILRLVQVKGLFCCWWYCLPIRHVVYCLCADPCVDNGHPCYGSQITCTKLNDTEFECGPCPRGMRGDGRGPNGCQYVNECEEVSPCFPGATCTDLNEGYLCGDCPPGYRGEQLRGYDIHHARSKFQVSLHLIFYFIEHTNTTTF